MNPYLSIILAGILWGTGGLIIRFIDLPSISMSFFRVISPTVAVLLWFFLKRSKFSITWSIPLAIVSVLNAIRMYLYFVSYSLTTMGNAVIMIYTWPIFASLFGMLFFHEKTTSKKLLLLFLSFIGMILMFTGKTFSFHARDMLGMGIMILSSMIYALTMPIYKRELQKTSRLLTIFYQNIAGAIIYLPVFLMTYPYPTLIQSASGIGYGFVIGFLCFLLFFQGLRHVSASTAGGLSYVEVITSVLLGAIILQEPITITMILGAVCILGSAYFLRFEK